MLLLAPSFWLLLVPKAVGGRGIWLPLCLKASQQCCRTSTFLLFKLFLPVITNISHCILSRRKLGVNNPFFFSSVNSSSYTAYVLGFLPLHILTNSVLLWGTNYSMSIDWTLVGNFVYSKHFKILMYCLNHKLVCPLTLAISRLDSSQVPVGGFCHLVYDRSLLVANLFL